MALSTGTALHHGNYVVDAFSFEDAIGPVYLATHIPSGRWVQLRILGSRHPEAIPDGEVRKAFYNYLLTVQALNHPLFSGHLSGFEDEGVCYQAIDAALGQPLSRQVDFSQTLSPRQSVALVRQVAQGLIALKPLGWQGITLTPDQLWQRSNGPELSFIGFDFPAQASLPENQQEALVVKGLSHLLYFLLTGRRADDTQTPLAIDVRNQFPGLPYNLDTALQLGSQQAVKQPSIGLKQWLDLLPSAEAMPAAGAVPTMGQKTVVNSPEAYQLHHQAQVSKIPATATRVAVPPTGGAQTAFIPGTARMVPKAKSLTARRFAPVALVLTALAASFGGLSLGLTARLQPANTSGSPVRLNPEQSFPPLSDWGGDDPINSWDYTPSRQSLPDYGRSAPQPVLAVPNTAPEPSSGLAAEEELTPLDDGVEEDSLERISPSGDGDDFFAQPEPFTSGPDPSFPTYSIDTLPDGDLMPPKQDATPEPVAPVQPAVEPLPLAPAAPPKPLTPPVPLHSPPPSAPAPSTSQGNVPGQA